MNREKEILQLVELAFDQDPTNLEEHLIEHEQVQDRTMSCITDALNRSEKDVRVAADLAMIAQIVATRYEEIKAPEAIVELEREARELIPPQYTQDGRKKEPTKAQLDAALFAHKAHEYKEIKETQIKLEAYAKRCENICRAWLNRRSKLQKMLDAALATGDA